MPLIVEDGTGVEDANSYVSLDDAKAIAAMRGIILAASDTELETNLVAAADRITSYEDDFTGERVTGDQGLSYPRTMATRYGKSLSETAIPKELKLAQVTLAGYINAGFVLWASAGLEGVTSEKIGPIEIQYAEAVVSDSDNPTFAQIEAILEPLFAPFTPNFLMSR